jgi:hypothetical protein
LTQANPVSKHKTPLPIFDLFYHNSKSAGSQFMGHNLAGEMTKVCFEAYVLFEYQEAESQTVSIGRPCVQNVHDGNLLLLSDFGGICVCRMDDKLPLCSHF